MRLCIASLLLILAAAAHAAIPDGLIEALRPADGVIVKLDGDDCLIDLGSNGGLRDGDLVAVLNRAEELRHPLSGKLLGQLDSIKTLLRVVRLKPDFAWARPLVPGTTLGSGDPVRRFGEVPALFLPRQETDHPLFNELQRALPHLAWRPWGEETLAGPGLRFFHEGDDLIVRDHSGIRLGAWPLVKPANPSTPAGTAVVAGQLRPIEGHFSGKGRGLVVVDLDGDGHREVAAAVDNQIEFGAITGHRWQSLFTHKLPVTLSVLAIAAADLDGNGTAEVLISAVRGEQLAASVLSCNLQGCRDIATDLPWFLRVVDLPGRGLTPLAQQGGSTPGSDYYDQPFTLTLHKGHISRGEAVSLPAPLNLFGMQPFVSGGATLWSYFDSSDRLAVSDGREILWTSRDRFGGGENFIDKADRNKKRGESRRFYLPARLVRNGDLLAVPQNLGDGSFASHRSAKASRLVGLRWNGRALEDVWGSPESDGYLADFAYDDINNDGQAEYLLLGSRDGGLFERAVTTLSVWQP